MGTVLRAGTYTLYCHHVDQYVVIEPDAPPGWKVKLLHVTGLPYPTARPLAAATRACVVTVKPGGWSSAGVVGPAGGVDVAAVA